MRDACRAGPARRRGEVGEERGVGALPEAEGEGHLLFADGLVEEADVSVDLRTGITSRFRRRCGGELELATYRVIDGLRESDFFLRSAHDLIH